jgi:pimeloyl-ACP methyl ester carboxylesterase
LTRKGSATKSPLGTGREQRGGALHQKAHSDKEAQAGHDVQRRAAPARSRSSPPVLRAALLLVLLFLAACASVPPLTVDPATVKPAPPPLAAAQQAGAVATYRAPDGRELAYRAYGAYRAGATQAATAVVYVHGIESHGVWFALAAAGLQQRGYDVFLLDRRGSGLNRENRGFVSGDAGSDAELLSDVEAFLAEIRHGYRRVALVGLSWGGKLALAESLNAPRSVDALILITPGLVASVGYGALEKVQIASAALVRPEAAFRTPIEPEMFTTTPVWLAFIQDDPLRLRYVTARFLMATRGLDRTIAREAGERRTPALLVLAGRDRIVDNEGARLLMARGPGDLTIVTYPDQTHSVQLDDVDRLVADMTAWLEGKP